MSWMDKGCDMGAVNERRDLLDRIATLERELAEARAAVTRWEESAAKWATERIEKHGTEPPASELADMRFQLAQARAELEAVRMERDKLQSEWAHYVEPLKAELERSKAETAAWQNGEKGEVALFIEKERRMQARLSRLEAVVRALHEWRGVGLSKLEAWERIAEMFNRDTGFLRPGKDVAAAMDYEGHEEERSAAWAEWVKRKNDELDAALAAALGEVG